MPIKVEENTAEIDHIVQFYERDEDLVRSVADYLQQGLETGETVVVVATEGHRRAFEQELEAAGVDVVELVGQGRVQMFDAAGTLSRFVTEARLDRERFCAVLGAALREATGRGRRVQVAVTSKPGRVCISVHDASSVLPIPRDQELMAHSGRGLGLVAAVSRRWGVELTPDGKVVWAELGR